MSDLPENASPGTSTKTGLLPTVALLAGLATLMLVTILVSREIVDGAMRWVLAIGAGVGVGLLVFVLGRARRDAGSVQS